MNNRMSAITTAMPHFHHRIFIKRSRANRPHRSFTSAASAPAAQFCDEFKAGVSLCFPSSRDRTGGKSGISLKA